MDENKDVQQTEQQDKQPAPPSEARKTALLRYMAGAVRGGVFCWFC